MIYNNGEFLGDKYLLSVSGGKDSTAMILHLKEFLIQPEKMNYVFMNTGWENPITLDYLDYLQNTLNIEIDHISALITVKDKHKTLYQECCNILGVENSQFVALILKKGTFPKGFAQFCTTELKVNPFKTYLQEQAYQAVSCVGIRREESQRRSTYNEYEFNEGFDAWVWRPIIEYTEQQVIDIHKRHNIRPNPLYLSGAHRVGCYPCIRSNKQEMKHFSLDDATIKVIHKLEQYFKILHPHLDMRFFKMDTIKNVLEWSQTSYGGKQYFLFDDTTPTCEKWGMCGI